MLHSGSSSLDKIAPSKINAVGNEGKSCNLSSN